MLYSILPHFVPFCPVSLGSPDQNPKKCYGHYGHLVFFAKSAMVTPMVTPMVAMVTSFFPKAPRPDHSDHNPTIGLTIALLLPNKRATIVTIAPFWVLPPRSPGTWDKTGHLGQNGTFGTKWAKTVQTFAHTATRPFLDRSVRGGASEACKCLQKAKFSPGLRLRWRRRRWRTPIGHLASRSSSRRLGCTR